MFFVTQNWNITNFYPSISSKHSTINNSHLNGAGSLYFLSAKEAAGSRSTKLLEEDKLVQDSVVQFLFLPLWLQFGQY